MPNGSWRLLSSPDSGSFPRLSRSGSSPGEKPKGRSAIPSTVLTAGRPRGRRRHAVGERVRTVSGVNRRILTLLVALLPIIAFGALLGAVTVPYVSLGPGPTFNTLGEFDGKEVVDIEGTQVFPATGHLQHDHGRAARPADAGPGGGAMDVGARAAGAPRPGLSTRQVA